MATTQFELVRADTHVHFYESFDEQEFLRAAVRNLCRPAEAGRQALGVLMLTETSDCNWFDSLRQRGADAGAPGEWSIEESGDDISLLVRDGAGATLVVVAGRQVVCAERIEVLALGLNGRMADGAPIRDVLLEVSRAGAYPVVAWGVGKWTGARRDVVAQLIDDSPCQFALGDNGGRLRWLPAPPLFKLGQQQGLPVLPGTDLLPFIWNCDQVGSYGLEWRGNVDLERPGRAVIDTLSKGLPQPATFGRLQGLPGFLKDQVSIQLKNRTGRTS